MQTQNSIAALRQSCVLAKLSFTSLGMVRTDRVASSHIAATAQAPSGAATLFVSRLPGADQHHRAITAAQHMARVALHSRSMPYLQEHSWRILPNRQIDPMLKSLENARVAFHQARDALKKDADNVLAAAKRNAGTLAVELPTKRELVSAYTIKLDIDPIPGSSGVPFQQVGGATQANLIKFLDQRLEKAVDFAKRDTLGRWREPLENFIERMRMFDLRGKAHARGSDPGKIGVFRDSVVGNLKVLFQVLPDFNFMVDAHLTHLGNLATPVAGLEVDKLREDEAYRRSAVGNAKHVLDRINSWLVEVL